MFKVKTTITSDNSIAVILPAETLNHLGISGGDDVDVTTTDNALILRSVEQAEKSRSVQAATEKVFNRWDNVFTELAKGTEADK